MTLVPGDPASLSACARTTQAVAQRLGEQARGVRTASEQLADDWGGRGSAVVRHRAAGLADAAVSTATELDRVGRVLQDHASDLADLVARGRALEERAHEVGLEVRDGRVEIAWGVTGTADAASDQRREAAHAALTSELDLVLAQHRRRRDFVLGVLRESTASLAGVSHDLRGG